jgi:hypothetical protein
MKKHASRLIFFGCLALGFFAYFLVLCLGKWKISLLDIYAVIIGATVSFGFAFYSLWKLTEKGHLMTNMRQLLKGDFY